MARKMAIYCWVYNDGQTNYTHVRHKILIDTQTILNIYIIRVYYYIKINNALNI